MVRRRRQRQQRWQVGRIAHRELIGTLPLDATLPTACCFWGGLRMLTLFLTRADPKAHTILLLRVARSGGCRRQQWAV